MMLTMISIWVPGLLYLKLGSLGQISSLTVMFFFFLGAVIMCPGALCFGSLSESLTLDVISGFLVLLSSVSFYLMILSSRVSFMKVHFWMDYFFWISLLMGALISAFLQESMLSFYLLFELTLIPIFCLILGWGYQPERAEAGSYMMIYTILSSMPLLWGVLWINQSLGSMGFDSLKLMSSVLPWGLKTAMVQVSFVFAFLVKFPMYMVHFWLPKAHVEAPVVGSMVLAGVLLKLGGYGLLRMAPEIIGLKSATTVAGLSLAGGVYVSLLCFQQTDIKVLIAYSSVSHMSLAISSALMLTWCGASSSLLMLISHGFVSPAMFMLGNVVYLSSHSRSSSLNKGMLVKSSSITFWFFMICALNMAVPPTLNFFSEATSAMSILSLNFTGIVPLSFLFFLAAGYSLLLYTFLAHGDSPHGHSKISPSKESLYLSSALHVFFPVISVMGLKAFIS